MSNYDNDSYNKYDNDFDYYDEYPEEDPFQDADDYWSTQADNDEAEYREDVEDALIDALDEYLTVFSIRDLIRLVANYV